MFLFAANENSFPFFPKKKVGVGEEGSLRSSWLSFQITGGEIMVEVVVRHPPPPFLILLDLHPLLKTLGPHPVRELHQKHHPLQALPAVDHLGHFVMSLLGVTSSYLLRILHQLVRRRAAAPQMRLAGTLGSPSSFGNYCFGHGFPLSMGRVQAVSPRGLLLHFPDRLSRLGGLTSFLPSA